MEEFSSYAVWIIIIFLTLNSMVFWFSNTDTFIENRFSVGIAENTNFGSSDQNSFYVEFYGTDCSTVSATDVLILPCSIAQMGTAFAKIIGQFWDFVTGFTRLLNVLLPDWIPGASMVKGLLSIILGVIQALAIFVILSKLAGVIRGGS